MLNLQYQNESAKKLASIVNQYGGGCLFDETGLGKTITTVKAVELLKPQKVLVISPVSAKRMWENNSNFKICGYNSIPNDETFELVIVDEAHRLKNPKTKGYQSAFELIWKSNAKVILLTATPVNNNAGELINMLALILFNPNELPFWVLGTHKNKIDEAEKTLNKLKRFNGDFGFANSNYSYQDIGELVKAEMQLKFELAKLKKVMQAFCIRNTRKSISEQYPNDIEMLGMFPNVENVELSYEKESSFYKKFGETVKLLNKMPLARQNYMSYVDKNNTNDFGGLFRSHCLKRLESSVKAFKETLNNSLETLLSFDSVEINGEIWDVAKLGGNFISDLKQDEIILDQLLQLWDGENDVEKLKTLFSQIEKGQKIVIFTEYKSTLSVIEAYLKKHKIKFLSYSSENSEKDIDLIIENFDANCSTKPTKQFDVLVCTDILSEGISLHNANKLIHFDQKWNPSRSVQREGRINRIIADKSEPKNIQTMYFRVDPAIEHDLRLELRLDNKRFIADQILNDFVFTPFEPEILPLEEGKRYFIEDETKDVKFCYYINNKFVIAISAHFSIVRNDGVKSINIINPKIYMLSEKHNKYCLNLGMFPHSNIVNFLRIGSNRTDLLKQRKYHAFNNIYGNTLYQLLNKSKVKNNLELWNFFTNLIPVSEELSFAEICLNSCVYTSDQENLEKVKANLQK